MMSPSSPTCEHLIANLNNIFFSGESTWLNNLTDSNIESLFTSGCELEKMIQNVLKEAPEDQQVLNQQLHEWFLNNNLATKFNLSDYEMACDRLLIVFFNNTNISNRALSKAVSVYLSIFSKTRTEKLCRKMIAQCAMSTAVLAIKADCDLDGTKQGVYNTMIYKDLPRLVENGKRGFGSATLLIIKMMTESSISLETLLKAMLSYEEGSVLQLFVQGTMVKTLEKVDNNYITFWKLLLNIKDRSLLPKFADKYPDFLLTLKMFISCCGDGLKLTVDANFELQWDCQESLLTHKELVILIKCVLNSGGISSASIKELLTERQQMAMGDAEDHSSVWIELGVLCIN